LTNTLRHPVLKISTQNRTGGVAQGVECLTTKHEALNLIPVLPKEKKDLDCDCLGISSSGTDVLFICSFLSYAEMSFSKIMI
jgi:hypothetical protein